MGRAVGGMWLDTNVIDYYSLRIIERNLSCLMFFSQSIVLYFSSVGLNSVLFS